MCVFIDVFRNTGGNNPANIDRNRRNYALDSEKCTSVRPKALKMETTKCWD